jgi:hypothetical protein
MIPTVTTARCTDNICFKARLGVFAQNGLWLDVCRNVALWSVDKLEMEPVLDVCLNLEAESHLDLV